MSATARSSASATGADIRRPWFGTTRASVSGSVTPRWRPHLVPPPPSPAPVTPIRVLIADDDEMIRRTLIDAIEHTQVLAVIATAKNADEAIRIASLRHPDVVLLDVRMPNGGGPRAAREISWRSPDTRIVALSAHDDPRSVDDMLASGATSYLVKDSSLEEIVEAVTRSIDGGASLADSVTEHVASELGSRLALERELATERRDKRERIHRVIRGTSPMNIVYQPIVELTSGTVVGLEALARFPDESVRPPDEWFDEAAEVGLGAQLQATAVRSAFRALSRIPADVFLSVNVDPRDAASPELLEALRSGPSERIVIELTEHAPASDYPRLRQALDPLRAVRRTHRGGRRRRGVLEPQAHPRAGAGHHQARHHHRAQHRHRAVASRARIRSGRLRERDRERSGRGRGRDRRRSAGVVHLGGPAHPGLLRGTARPRSPIASSSRSRSASDLASERGRGCTRDAPTGSRPR